MNPEIEVRLEIRLPNGQRLGVAVPVSEHAFGEAFSPLDRNRELPFMIGAQNRARRQQEMRRTVARGVASDIAAAMMKLLEKNDPQHGYSPEEWRQINQT